MTSPQSHFITQMVLLFSSRLCYLTGPSPIPLLNGDDPLISLGEPPLPSTQEVQVSTVWLVNVPHPVTTTTGLTSSGVVGVNTRNLLEHLDEEAQLVGFNSGETSSYLVKSWEKPA